MSEQQVAEETRTSPQDARASQDPPAIELHGVVKEFRSHGEVVTAVYGFANTLLKQGVNETSAIECPKREMRPGRVCFNILRELYYKCRCAQIWAGVRRIFTKKGPKSA